MKTTHVVIIGGGFVGLPVAKKLASHFRMHANVHITLIDAKSYFTFLPRLTDAIHNEVKEKYINASYAHLAKKYGFTFICDTVLNINTTQKKITRAASPTPLEFDYLVYSPGSITNFYETPGAKEFSYTLKSWNDVQRIHKNIDILLSISASPSFVVVGAGPTGIEAIFSLQKYILQRCSEKKIPSTATYTLIQAATQILPGFHEKIVRDTMIELEKKGIRVITADPAILVEKSFVELKHSGRIPSDFILWTAGIKRQAIDINPPPNEDRGHFFLIDSHLDMNAYTFAGGDAASCDEKKIVIPKNAQTAYKMSRTISENIIRSIAGAPLVPFHYSSRGIFLPIADTCFLHIGPFVFKSKIIKWLRDIVYTQIFLEITR